MMVDNILDYNVNNKYDLLQSIYLYHKYSIYDELQNNKYLLYNLHMNDQLLMMTFHEDKYYNNLHLFLMYNDH